MIWSSDRNNFGFKVERPRFYRDCNFDDFYEYGTKPGNEKKYCVMSMQGKSKGTTFGYRFLLAYYKPGVVPAYGCLGFVAFYFWLFSYHPPNLSHISITKWDMEE